MDLCLYTKSSKCNVINAVLNQCIAKIRIVLLIWSGYKRVQFDKFPSFHEVSPVDIHMKRFDCVSHFCRCSRCVKLTSSFVP